MGEGVEGTQVTAGDRKPGKVAKENKCRPRSDHQATAEVQRAGSGRDRL